MTTGMDWMPDQAAGVFDPALSKTGDPAAALALARAYSVVHDWGGDIAFASEPGQGSTFTIYLPYIEPEGASRRSRGRRRRRSHAAGGPPRFWWWMTKPGFAS